MSDTSRRDLNGLNHIIHDGRCNLHILDVDAVLLTLLLDEVREFFELLLIVIKLHNFMSDSRGSQKGGHRTQIFRFNCLDFL